MRATIIACECLVARNHFDTAAIWFIKMTNDEADLISGLLLEQVLGIRGIGGPSKDKAWGIGRPTKDKAWGIGRPSKGQAWGIGRPSKDKVWGIGGPSKGQV